eukprot:jgi/Undpi1/58/HiC_scaffold_1.g00058.m1
MDESRTPPVSVSVSVSASVLILSFGVSTGGCHHAITAAEAEEHAGNASLPGNTIILGPQLGGQAGNHFECVSQFLSMAYCCKSSLLVLPEFDPQIPGERGTAFKSTHRWYDFSGARMDLLPEFANLSERPNVCEPKRLYHGIKGFNLVGVHPELLRCLNHVFVRGCEAKYLGAVVDKPSFCDAKVDQSAASTLPNHHRRRAETNNLKPNRFESPPRALSPAPRQIAGTDSSQRAGSLVIHIRSGDIFDPTGEGSKRPGFGQPPLEFYLGVIAERAWSDVSILTFWQNTTLANPTYVALDLLNSFGMLGPNVVLHHERRLVEDLRTMLCADALALARSSLHFLTLAHTRASTIYLPVSCGPGKYRRKSRIANGLEPKKNPDNATLLVLEKPEAEVCHVV